ncbi:non-heme iron oxygenase ferredoxin subunit [Emcibacter nanhaiensis]|uniref:Non-heme iron oxygenase ferredoxin subunit n=1 Tax=Emcibacter nanhaiensis TaxID=1505037 RepID=A0A501PVJ9_9PROT|nr:non-heme iron oxygenase ferredoxin subunit [Emcibacter nanhaiensis]TPD63796.1 non-heme iron oxygenase ferredoxin subunit [Emcibacter nanhaiensis]
MSLIKVCDEGQLKPGEMMAVENDELPPIALYNIDGTYYATSNICTHAIAILTEGFLEGDTIECPLHGGAFNAKTGEATNFPCEEPLQTYEVQVKDGEVFIEA